MKNYIGFVNDHSGSMDSLATAAARDYNATIAAVKNAATREMLDTVVSVVGIGLGNGGYGCERQVVISNPHVLKPVTNWPTPGGTPLYDGIGNMIELLEALPDAGKQDVSFLVMVTTDGEEAHSRIYNRERLAKAIKAKQDTGRWTFVVRVPRGARSTVSGLNIPLDNVQEWETSVKGMEASTQATTAAVDGYYATRSAGSKSSNVFYANAAQVNTSALIDISKKVSLYVVGNDQNGIQIRDFVLTKRMAYLKGAAFYQLTKTEARVSPTKLIAIRERSTGKVFAGKDARDQLGLSSVNNIRLHPGDHGNFDLFIQSESVNRKLVAGTGLLYWEEIGKPFTDADLAYLQPKPVAPPKPAVVQLPQVPVSTRPTPSPLKPVPKAPAFNSYTDGKGRQRQMPQAITPSDGGRVRFYTAPPSADFYSTRDMARAQAVVQGKKQYDAGPTAASGKRFYVA